MKSPLAYLKKSKDKEVLKGDDVSPAIAKQNMEKYTYQDEHTMPLEDLAKKLETNFDTGLTKTQAEARLQIDGPNSLTPPKQTPKWLKFLKTMFSGFAALLWAAAALCFIAVGVKYAQIGELDMDNIYVGGALVVVVVLTGLFTYYQENKSSKIMESFEKMIPPKAQVLRDGQSAEIEAINLVVGDIVEIRGGDKVPADIRMLECHSIKVDNSSLTGESVPVSLKPDTSDPNHLESKNLAFYSTNVVEGQGRGVVVKTGDHTVMGCIANLVTTIDSGKTPINKEISKFVHLITAIALAIGLVFFIIAMSMGYQLIQSIVFVIGIIVANVPEGLLITVTITLTLTAQRMAKKNCLVKNLEGVETLGSTSVICSDKTGTLTQNKMTVAHLWLNGNMVELDTGKHSYASNFETGGPGWEELGKVACLCSNATFVADEGNMAKPVVDRNVLGDATEAGILKCYESIMGDSEVVRQQCPKKIGIPFNSRNKYQASVHEIAGRHRLVMKGAPEMVFSRCETILLNGKKVPISEEVKADFASACEELASMGERVLGFVDHDLDPAHFPTDFQFSTDDDEPNFPLTGLCFIGLMSMIDPPKATVPNAVSSCRSAGIKVIMVTGDHPITAQAIAKQVGILSSSPVIYGEETPVPSEFQQGVSACVPGYVMTDWSDDMLDQLIAAHYEIAFARTSPKQKLFIVEGYQRAGNIVAVTGDGVNDSPALKKADIGVAMGIAGTEVSKEAADMIILDDDFATIVHGVEEGRLIFDNLKKSIVYTLTSNIPEILPFLTWVVLRIPLPLGTIAILAVDLLTDMVPAISLAYEKPEMDIMQRPPRSTSDRLVNHRLIFLAYGIVGITQAMAGMFVYGVVMASYGWLPSQLINAVPDWEDKMINNMADSWGQEWTYEQRMVLQYTCQSAYFLAIVQVQWADVIISKTRVLSIFQQGMANWMLNFGLVFETCCAAFIIYFPYSYFINFYPLAPEWWIPALPFSLLIWVVDEARRYFVRLALRQDTCLGDFLTMETYY